MLSFEQQICPLSDATSYQQSPGTTLVLSTRKGAYLLKPPVYSKGSTQQRTAVDPDIPTLLAAGDYGLGNCANSLELGCDCVGNIHYFDANLVNTKGTSGLSGVLCQRTSIRVVTPNSNSSWRRASVVARKAHNMASGGATSRPLTCNTGTRLQDISATSCCSQASHGC